MSLFWARFRWAIITTVGCLYCFFAPRLFYKGRK